MLSLAHSLTRSAELKLSALKKIVLLLKNMQTVFQKLRELVIMNIKDLLKLLLIQLTFDHL